MNEQSAKIIFVCHDNNSVYNCLQKHATAHIMFVGQNTLYIRDSRITIVRDLPKNIEHEPKLLTFTAWYAIVHNNLFPESDTLCILEWDVYNVPDVLQYDKNIDVMGFFGDPDGRYFFLSNMNMNVYDKFLRDNGIDYQGYGKPWLSSSNYSMKRHILAAFVHWYYPKCLGLKQYDLDHLPWYHERAFWCFITHKQFSISFITGFAHAYSKSYETRGI